jgi:hypothetical protein
MTKLVKKRKPHRSDNTDSIIGDDDDDDIVAVVK